MVRAGRCNIIGTSINGKYGLKLFISIQCLITSLDTMTWSTGRKETICNELVTEIVVVLVVFLIPKMRYYIV